MTSETDLEKEQRLFSRCLEHPESEWEHILETGCDDPELRKRVRRLLDRSRDASHDDAGFLRLDGSDPERIGPYRILQRLGEGGMGIVYAAEQREPVRRRVAVKVLRSGYNSREVLARFDVERQALALMNHPNVARIIDAGTTADQRPYIVMEFVPGEPVTTYCDKHRVPLRRRLELFATICEAVQHAHQKGIIHRDLKPSNMLVMEEDGRPVAKIIDFGIAKAMTQRLTDHTLETKVGSLMGTPDYMSPEQAELSPLDVDTRSDVYALGAVLYQLLTGEPPLRLSGSGKSYSELQRAILEDQPLPPSRRIDKASGRKLRGELDWITMKALEKRRALRYTSAADLAADLHAFLNGGTIIAGPPSRWRKIGKFARRHWLATAATVAVIATLAISQTMLVKKNRELEAERDRANREAQIASRVTRFTADLFKFASPTISDSGNLTAHDLLNAAVRQLEQANESAEVKAALLEAAATGYRDLGVFDEAERLLTLAHELYGEVHGVDSASHLRTLLGLAHIQHARGRGEAAEAMVRDALSRIDPTVLPLLHVSAQALLGHILYRQTRLDEAASLLSTAIEDGKALPDAAREVAYATAVLGQVRRGQGKFDVAEKLLRSAIELSGDPAVGAEGTRAQLVRDARSALAGLYADVGRHDDAVRLQREMLAEGIRLYGEDHPETATMLNNLGRALLYTKGNEAEAESVLLRAAETYEATLGPTNRMTLIARDNLSSLYLRTRQWQKAIAIDSEVLLIRQELLGDDSIDTAYSKASLAKALMQVGEVDRATALWESVAATYIAHYGEHSWPAALMRREYANVLAMQQRFPEAIAELEKAYDAFVEFRGTSHADTKAVLAALENFRSMEREHRDRAKSTVGAANY